MAYEIAAMVIIILQMKIKVYKGDITSHSQKQSRVALRLSASSSEQAFEVGLHTSESLRKCQCEIRGSYLQAQSEIVAKSFLVQTVIPTI